MANLIVKDPPEFTEEICAVTEADKITAELENQIKAALLNNDVFLKVALEILLKTVNGHIEAGEIHVTEKDKEYWDRKAETTAATQSAAGLMSAGDKQKLDNVAANAEVNQNAYSNIKIGEVTITANGKTATFTLEAGSNITLSADNAAKKIIITANRDGGNAETLDGYHAEHFAAADHGHDGRYYTKAESDNQLKTKAAASHSHTKASIIDFPTSMPPTEHYHDGRYYTETEVNNLLAGKAASSHSHAYLPLSGGTMTGEIGMSLDRSIRWNNKDNASENALFVMIPNIINGSGARMAIYPFGWSTFDNIYKGIIIGERYQGSNLSISSLGTKLYDIGTLDNKFNNVYAVTGTIQTSDREKKKDIKEFDDKFVEDFIMGLIPVSYMFKENESGRTHYGLIAQDVEELMDRLEMDSKDFAGFIKSPKYETIAEEIEVENEVIGEDGKKKIVKEKRYDTKSVLVENEYEYALRYEEFISPIIKMLQILNNKLDSQREEIGKLKTQIEALKAK